MTTPRRHPYTTLTRRSEQAAWLSGWWEGVAVGCALALALCVLLGIVR